MSEDKETIYLGDEAHEITVRPITIIAKSPNVIHDIRTPNRIMIDAQMTVEHTRTVKTFHEKTSELYKIVFKDYHREVTPENIRREGSGSQHAAGLIDLSLTLIDQKINIGWRYPESYLHPAAQVELADVLIWLMRWANEHRVQVTL